MFIKLHRIILSIILSLGCIPLRSGNPLKHDLRFRSIHNFLFFLIIHLFTTTTLLLGNLGFRFMTSLIFSIIKSNLFLWLTPFFIQNWIWCNALLFKDILRLDFESTFLFLMTFLGRTWFELWSVLWWEGLLVWSGMR